MALILINDTYKAFIDDGGSSSGDDNNNMLIVASVLTVVFGLTLAILLFLYFNPKYAPKQCRRFYRRQEELPTTTVAETLNVPIVSAEVVVINPIAK